MSQEFRLKKIDQTRNYLIEDDLFNYQNELISKKYKKVYRFFSYIEHLLILTSRVA